MLPAERQVTHAPQNHILTNTNVWSRDGRRLVYDTRSDPAGSRFDGDCIETVDVETGEVRRLYQSSQGAMCGVATFSPTADRVVFILGPENPADGFTYGAARRRGVMVDESRPGVTIPLDGRDLVPPFTAGALRGGSHVHVFSPDGLRISFTYEDHVLESRSADDDAERNQRNVGVCDLDSPVMVSHRHPRNHDGSGFSVVVTRTVDNPRPGTDEIARAYEDAWIGTRGYLRDDGTWQRWAIAFQGLVTSRRGEAVPEVFVVDLPEDLTIPGDGPLQGTATTRPRPPAGIVQRRRTFTAEAKSPGVSEPRHWLRTSPDGSRIAFLRRDGDGIVQLWTVSPAGGEPIQVTRNAWDVGSAFTWSPDGTTIAHTMNGSVCITNMAAGSTRQLTLPTEPTPRPEACVFSPDGRSIAYVRPVVTQRQPFNQLFLCRVPS